MDGRLVIIIHNRITFPPFKMSVVNLHTGFFTKTISGLRSPVDPLDSIHFYQSINIVECKMS